MFEKVAGRMPELRRLDRRKQSDFVLNSSFSPFTPRASGSFRSIT